jgi:phosphate acyltransferase
MGGDHAPDVPVRAAVDAVDQLDVEISLVGDANRIHRVLAEHQAARSERIRVVDAPEQVAMEDAAVAAVRSKRRASIPVALELVKSGDAAAFMSAGNTGAVVASAVVSLGRLSGVHRPGIAIPIPTISGIPSLLIDAGAIVDPKPEFLWQHAKLALTYARVTSGVSNPTVGLINNGEEAGKGNQLSRAAFELLHDDPEILFIGNVQPREMVHRPCDVLVTDGFTGNIVLKTGEGIVNMMQESLRAELRSRWYTSLLAMMLKPAFRRAGRSLDYREYGGAPLLGVDGLVMISHGSSDTPAIAHAIRGVTSAIDRGLMTELRETFRGQAPDS